MSEAVKARNESVLQAKIFSKAMKLSIFSYRIREDKDFKVGCEDCREKYVVANLPPRSPSVDLVGDEKLSFSNINLDDNGAIPWEDDSTPNNGDDSVMLTAAILAVGFVNPSIERWGM